MRKRAGWRGAGRGTRAVEGEPRRAREGQHTHILHLEGLLLQSLHGQNALDGNAAQRLVSCRRQGCVTGQREAPASGGRWGHGEQLGPSHRAWCRLQGPNPPAARRPEGPVPTFCLPVPQPRGLRHARPRGHGRTGPRLPCLESRVGPPAPPQRRAPCATRACGENADSALRFRPGKQQEPAGPSRL